MLRVSSHPLPAQVFVGSRPNTRIRAVEEHRHCAKPGRGGLWTCDERVDKRITWAEYAAACCMTRYATSRAWRLRPRADTRVFVLDTLRDARWLQEHYPRWPDSEYAAGLFLPLTSHWYPTLDWPKLSQDFDGVRLSARGFRTLGDIDKPLCDWSVPSTVWFRYCFVGEPEHLAAPGNA